MDDGVIKVCQPTIDQQTRDDLNHVFDTGWLGQGPKTREFEEKFASYVGAKYAVATNSGTAALDLCLKAYDIKGGELITTPLTFVSDAIVGEWQGMDVTFGDIDEESLCLDPKSLHLSENTKAIIAVDSHGRLADVEGIKDEIEKFNITSGIVNEAIKPLVIEDAAHACFTPGVGQHADITMWSFQAVKTLPTADGGAITTNDEAIWRKIKTLTWLGVEKPTYDRAMGRKYTWDYDIKGLGIKGYMNDVQSTIALGQLRRLDEMSAKRRAIQTVYNDSFKDIKEITPPAFSYTVQYYTMKCEDRDKLSEHLAENKIATSVHLKPLYLMTYWAKGKKRELPVTDKVWVKLLSLPCHDALTWKQVEYVVKKVREFYGHY